MKIGLWLTVSFVILLAGIFAFVMFRIYRSKFRVPPRSPLAQAVSDGDLEKVRTLLKAGADANSVVNDTYLIQPNGEMQASFVNSITFVGISRLPPQGLQSSTGTPQNAGIAVLALASLHGNIEIMRILLEYGADVNSKDEHGQTPLIFAAWNGNVEAVRFLLNHHADKTVRDWAGKTALMWAQSEDHTAVVEAISSSLPSAGDTDEVSGGH